MPGKHKPTKVSQAITQQDNGKYSKPDNGHHCKKSPTGSHYWQIGSPGGELSAGVCRYCNEQRPFANTLKAAFELRGKR